MTASERYDSLKIMAIQKVTGGTIACQRCGFDNPLALQFDHKLALKRGACIISKSGRPYYPTSGSNLIKSILNGAQPSDEIQVLCANCHAIKTTEEKRTK